MEPRPQRPRTPQGDSRPASQPGANPQDTHGHAAAFPPGVDSTAFVAPPRTEYDYSPLDLAPPGQRRRRQFVAAVIGGLSVLLLGAIVFFAYLLLRDDAPLSEDDTLAAAQTEVANDAATVSANQTVVAQAAADQTAEAGPGDASGETPASETTGESDGVTTEPAAGQATEEASNSGDTIVVETPEAPDLSGNAPLDEAGLTALLPAQDQVPAALTAGGTDTVRSEEEVLEALGGGRLAETNLDDWEWSGNVERAYENPDPINADQASTTYVSVSVHGFGTAAAAGEALPFFSDILVSAGGYAVVDSPDIGEGAQLLETAAEDGGTWVTLYVQDGSVLYRIFAISPEGDPSADAIALARDLIG